MSLLFAKHSPYASNLAELGITIIGFDIISVRHLDASLPASSVSSSCLLPEISRRSWNMNNNSADLLGCCFAFDSFPVTLLPGPVIANCQYCKRCYGYGYQDCSQHDVSCMDKPEPNAGSYVNLMGC